MSTTIATYENFTEEELGSLLRNIYNFTELLCFIPPATGFYPYQKEFALTITRDVLLGLGNSITGLFSRQSGKSETVADVAAALMVILPKLANLKHEDHRFVFPQMRMFASGYKVGIFAPSGVQATTTYSRLRDRLTSPTGRTFLDSPEFALEGHDSLLPFVSNTSSFLQINNGSLCQQMSADKQSKIESKTFNLILLDESQDLDSYVVGKSIMPMGAATNATTVATGTPGTTKGYFYNMIASNKREQLNRRRDDYKLQTQLHFEYDYKEVQKWNTNYEKYVRKEKKKIGADSDEFQQAYCVSPETRILTANLDHIPAGSIKVGDELVGFDEERPKKACHRRFRKAVVEDVGIITRPCYKLKFDDGTELTCSGEHQWLVINGGRTIWKSTHKLTPADTFFKICSVWESESTYEGGYLAAAFDGEGCYNYTDLAFAQRDNAMLEMVCRQLEHFNFRYSVGEVQGTPYKGVKYLKILGGRSERMRFLGQIRPRRLLFNLAVDKLGTIGRHDRKHYTRPRLVSKEFVGEREVVAIRTSTRTYVAEGFASHNCLKWLLERGMAVPEALFWELTRKDLNITTSYKGEELVAGLDWGKSQDSTVLTVGKPIWSDIDESGRCPVEVLYWWHKLGDNYEEIFAELKQELSMFSISTLACDATGTGEPLADRLIWELPHITVLPVKFSAQSKDHLYKWFLLMLQERRCWWPGFAEVRNRKYWKMFEDQMTNLVKEYKGQYLSCHHPEDQKNAHDDFPDSLALMLWTINEEAMPFVEVQNGEAFRGHNWYKAPTGFSLR